MHRRLFNATLLALTVPTAAERERATPARDVIELAGKQRSFHAYAPHAHAHPAHAPLLVLLHGSGQGGISMLREWLELAAQHGLVVVAPDSLSRDQWHLRDDGPAFVREVVRAVAEQHAVDSKRIYLFGHSGGAVYALTLSMLESQFFAATAVHAGAWRDPKEFGALKLATRKIPLSIFVGDVDPFFPLAAVRATEKALKDAGHPVEVTIIKHHGHRYSHVAPRVNAAAWEFLQRVSLALLVIAVLSFVAPGPVAHAQGVPERVRACVEEGDDARRLACYDREIGRAEPELEETPGAPIHATVARIAERADGTFMVTLDNGQVWAQKARGYVPLRVGDTVTIRAGALRSVWLFTDARRSTQVKRLR